MRYSTAVIVAAMGIGEAMAGPAHAHLHRRVHEKKDIDWSTLDWDAMGINWSSAWAAGQAEKTEAAAAPAATVVQTTAAAAAAPAATAAAAAPAAAAGSASSNSGSSLASDLGDALGDIVNDVKLLFGGVVGVSNSLTAFGAASNTESGSEVSYIGNYGSPYGSNIIKVDSPAGYDFTTNFVNTQATGITVNCWNKVGHDFQANSGQALAPVQTTLTMYLPAGKSQLVAFMANSQGGCAESTSNIAASGAFATTWFEFNMGQGGSGYDVSAIMNSAGNNYNMSISSLETPCVSNMNENMWLTPSDPVGTSDGSCYVPGNTATLTVELGGIV